LYLKKLRRQKQSERMQGYYNQPANPMMGGGMGMMQPGMMQPGMMQQPGIMQNGMGMQPGMGGMGMGMQNPMQQQMAYGNAWKQLVSYRTLDPGT
jgi:hypothetical protein